MQLTRLPPLLALSFTGLGGPQPVSSQGGKVLLVTKDGTSADLEWMLTQEVGVTKAFIGKLAAG